eukprot:TRINITY_DN20088_c0_g1_i1.p1 TRINITY_DN20088_c0_g1~~TRINITY_DN20088_c0_g1_i1.p1  ORF type:complete len:530 (+),score=146.48 TRINITY_DN20088_c0_g1_i1:43-1632(+)
MARMYDILFTLTLFILASVSMCDSDARIQSKLTPPHPLRPGVSKSAPDKSSRRTFVTAILAAEVAYLEGLLRKQNTKNENKKKQKSKPRKPVNNHIHGPKKVRPHHPHPTPAYKAPTTTTEYVSKLDPFYMITAPDLSVKSESYKAPEAPAVEGYNAPVKGVVTEVAPTTAPLPTYGAYQEYKVPAAPAITSKPSEKPTYQSTTTLKYGDFVLYQPKGYLPPPPPKKQAPPTYKVATPPKYKAPAPTKYKSPAPAPAYKKPEPKPVTYRPSKGYLPPVKQAKPAYKAPARPAYKAPAPAPAYNKPKAAPASYKPPKGYLPPVKKPKPAYKAPAAPPKYEAPAAPPSYKTPPQPTYKAPASVPAYKKPEPAPVTYRPSKGYLPPITKIKPAYKVTAAPAYKAPPPPKYEAPIEPPKYEAPVPSTEETKYEAPKEAPTYEAAVEAPAYEAPPTPAYKAPAPTSAYVTPSIPVYQPAAPTSNPSSAPIKSNPNPHPHTFFHDAQADKVHKGEWPPIYYNSLHGDQNRRRRRL